MVFDISQLKKIRIQLNMTQNEFSKKAGISQSMVAKIESGKLDPTYSYVKKIEETVESLTNSKEEDAEKIMHRQVIKVDENEKLKNVISLMNKRSISQIPVVRNNNILGLITESALLDLDRKEMNKKTAKDKMVESPPIIAPKTKKSVIIALLKFYPIVLVKESGKLCGVITKSDIIKSL